MSANSVMGVNNERAPLKLDSRGLNAPVFSAEGTKVCNGYNRTVASEKGMLIEVLPEDMLTANVIPRPGHTYRDTDSRFLESTATSLLTCADESNMHITFCKSRREGSNMVPGRYYLMPSECKFLPENIHSSNCNPTEEAISAWLKKHNVFNPASLKYHLKLLPGYAPELNYALEQDISPVHLTLYLKLTDLCIDYTRLNPEQYKAILYNFRCLGLDNKDLKANFKSLTGSAQMAIQLGLEGLELPYEIGQFDTKFLKTLFDMSAEELLKVSRLSKIAAGHKAQYKSEKREDELINDLDSTIDRLTKQAKRSGGTLPTPAKSEVKR